MNKQIENLKSDFKKIKEKGWIESKSEDSGGIGMTFENLLGIQTNELEIPDYGEIEIKTKTLGSREYTTLFNCVPTGPHYHEVERLKDCYGYQDKVLPNKKVLNAAVYCNRISKIGENFYFKLQLNRKIKKLFLVIYDDKKRMIEQAVYWDLDILEEKLYRKLKCLAFVKAKKVFINGRKHFKYYEMKIYQLKNFETFLKLICCGKIRICFKLGIYRKGKSIGKIHDRGTSFCIKEENLIYLYNITDIIE